jgi:hypothetical protein
MVPLAIRSAHFSWLRRQGVGGSCVIVLTPKLPVTLSPDN